MKKPTPDTGAILFSGDDWFDPLEEAVRFQVRGFIEAMVESELETALGGRVRYERKGSAKGYRHGRRSRQLIGTFGPVTLSLPRARLHEAGGGTREWRSATIRAHKRLTKQAEAVIAGAYL
ncbi:MAG: IS256 family transposase, partial [bacterium]|nr:IS256 family transposase [bacterium]